MKRVLSAVTVCFLLLSLFAVTVGALEDGASYVDDRIGLFSSDAASQLEARCQSLSEQFDTSCLILTTGSLGEEYGDLYEVSADEFEEIIMDYADEYLESVVGVGDENDGIVLVIYINEYNSRDRGYWISTQGDEYNLFDDSSVSVMLSSVKSYLSGGDYEGAAEDFLNNVEAVETGEGLFGTSDEDAYDYDYDYDAFEDFPWPTLLVISVIIGFVISLIIVLSMRAKMKNVRIATAADNYLREDTVNIRNCNVVFVRKTVTRTARQSSSSSSGGGGHTSSSGTHHGGGGGRF